MAGTNYKSIKKAMKTVEQRERYAKTKERLRHPRTSRILNRIHSRRRAA